MTTTGYGQQHINGGSGQGLMAAVPEAQSSEKLKSFKNITPENGLGWWRLNVNTVGFAAQGLLAVIDFDVDIPSSVRGYNASGGEKHYVLNELGANIRGSVKFRITGAYTDPRNKERKTFTHDVKVWKFGKSKSEELELFGYTGSVKDMTISQLLAKLDVKITSIEPIEKDISGYTRADQEVGKIIEKAKIDELESKKKTQEDQKLSDVSKKPQQEDDTDRATAVSGNDSKGVNMETERSTTVSRNGQPQTQELDFWGNPAAKKTAGNEVETVRYGGTEVQNNNHYQSQMELRERNANAGRAREVERAAERKRVDDQNNAIYNQGQQGIAQTNRDKAELDNSIEQLDVSSGKNLLESSGSLARLATSTGSVGQAKGALIGMGVGAVMAIGEGAAKRKAAREAREERDKLEKERVAKLKTALRNARTAVLSYFEAGELPISSIRTTGNNLYYFVYAMDRNQIEENSCQIYASNVFAIGRYPDGTWPMKTKVEQELNALTSSQETIHGPYSSLNEAQNSLTQFVQYAEKARMEVAYVEHKGFNAQVEGGRQSTGPALDFFGNPINQNPKKNQSTRKEKATPTKTSPKLDFFGNPIKE
ncbi:hypothetical protein FAZ19_04410 [Sphingobacterium alkalisoli]|uniref:Uncharacterized protein n=1 Tax=Sphingobacterium alkalisoli TaxID=1874115 RepID=A0A4U0H9D1_9SPHI|nr:hypothetical protein [Sphingobacterium alkalisoli]TJY68503.1 hypothetical protein FAZ19_04410 [Sphingobacterium alkalisoli]GGH06026.1 hypothetical protein GCM10011418_02530 [Sphingobacterium alkalisoli]